MTNRENFVKRGEVHEALKQAIIDARVQAGESEPMAKSKAVADADRLMLLAEILTFDEPFAQSIKTQYESALNAYIAKSTRDFDSTIHEALVAAHEINYARRHLSEEISTLQAKAAKMSEFLAGLEERLKKAGFGSNIEQERGYQTDCIHLHACRRLQYFARNIGVDLSRRCDERCNCYQVAFSVAAVEAENALGVSRAACESVADGYDPYDAVTKADFDTFDAFRIKNGPQCFDEIKAGEW